MYNDIYCLELNLRFFISLCLLLAYCVSNICGNDLKYFHRKLILFLMKFIFRQLISRIKRGAEAQKVLLHKNLINTV